MEEEYDVVVLGTGLTECILSGLLSVDGKKVLHMDRNNYYGGTSASLDLERMFDKFGVPRRSDMGRAKDYNIDLIPKFMMASGQLVEILLHTKTSRYLEFKCIEGSYVYIDRKINKVPSTAAEALRSDLMGFFQKRKAQKFLEWVNDWSDENPKTHKGYNIDKQTMAAIFKDFGLDSNAQDFIGHATALYDTDDYLDKPARETVFKIKLYANSCARFGKGVPYIYPLYGLGELPQAFARLAAIYGGTYMLNKPFEGVEFDASGNVCGVKSVDEEGKPAVARCKTVIADPTYFPDACKQKEKVVRIYCMLNHPIPNTKDTNSTQIIIPQKQVKRNHDIYVSCINYTHNVTAKPYFLAICSTVVETSDPEAELAVAVRLLGKIEQKFVSVTDVMTPIKDGAENRVFVSQSYDASTHFESTCKDVLSMYRRVTGSDLVIKIPEDEEQ